MTPEVRANAHVLHKHGGSPIKNSRVKLTNVKDCLKRGLVKEGENPLEVAARQLTKDGVTILHTVGGDDTNTTAADLAAYLAKNNYKLTVVGLPKTIDNDVYPIRQSLGAWTAAEQASKARDWDQTMAAIAAQSDQYATLLSDWTDADFRGEINMFGHKTSRGSFLVNFVTSGHAAYRTQLFCYLKSCGREELSTMNLWGGMDAPAAQA